MLLASKCVTCETYILSTALERQDVFLYQSVNIFTSAVPLAFYHGMLTGLNWTDLVLEPASSYYLR